MEIDEQVYVECEANVRYGTTKTYVPARATELFLSKASNPELVVRCEFPDGQERTVHAGRTITPETLARIQTIREDDE